jgi:hypothetical protein
MMLTLSLLEARTTEGQEIFEKPQVGCGLKLQASSEGNWSPIPE